MIDKFSSFLKAPLGDKQLHSRDDFQKELLKTNPNLTLLNQLKEKFQVDLNAQNSVGETFLHICARKNNTEALEYLLKNKVDVALKNHKNQTALYVAVIERNKLATLTILNSGVNIDEIGENGRTLFQELMLFATKPISEGLIVKAKKIANIDGDGRNILFDAVINGSIEILDMLLRLDEIDRNLKDKNGDTLLHLKSCIANPAMAMLLIKNGVNPTVRDRFGKPYLFYAIENGHDVAEIFSLAKVMGFDINIKDTNKNNAISHLIIYMNTFAEKNPQKVIDFAKLLLELVKLGVDVNSQNEQSLSPINLAAQIGNLNAFCILLKISYVTPELCDAKNRTIWHNLAISSNSVNCLDLLIAKCKAMLSSTDIFGMTPVEYAILKKHYELASKLFAIEEVEIKNHPKKNLIFLEIAHLDDVERIFDDGMKFENLQKVINTMKLEHKFEI